MMSLLEASPGSQSCVCQEKCKEIVNQTQQSRLHEMEDTKEGPSG